MKILKIVGLLLIIFILVFCVSKKNILKDKRDDKIYKTVKIGNQIWMAENLAYKSAKGCWSYNYDEKYVKDYAYLYEWETANKV